MSDEGFTPDPPQKMHGYQVLILFVYHVLLAIFLAYAIYNVWPPQPWPGDIAKAAAAAATNTNQTGNTNTNTAGGTTNTNSSQANANSNQGANVNSSNSNTNTNSNSNSNSSPPANTNRNTAVNNSTPVAASAASDPNNPYEGMLPPAFKLFWWWFQPTLETRLILLVLLAGAIGSYVHAASSLVDYLGNRTMISSWVWWYLLRPFIGMMLALIFYFVFRGGFITAGVNPGGESAAAFINPFGIAAMAGLVGMFSKVAADKLNEVFLTLFRPAAGAGDAKRGDKLVDGILPAITGIAPNTGAAAGGTLIQITGTGFMAGAKVNFGGVASPKVDVTNATSITATTPPHAAAQVDVEVVNPNQQKVTLKQGFTYTA